MAFSRFAVVWLCFPIVSSCDRAAEPKPGATPVAASDSVGVTSAPAAATGNPGSPCPRTGRWAICSLEKRLEQSGFVLKKVPAPTQRSGFSVQPVVYTLGRARLEVFVYPDESALSRDVANIDTTVAAPRGQSNDWEVPPRFMRSGNLAAVLLTRNELQAERVMLAITAGAPQPGS